MRHAVLVVDDYQDSREFMSMVLHNAGFIVRTATNGLEAVIAAYEMQPAVIVMDMIMPVLDGIEATRLIKAIDELRDARVIAYAAQPPIDPAADRPALLGGVAQALASRHRRRRRSAVREGVAAADKHAALIVGSVGGRC